MKQKYVKDENGEIFSPMTSSDSVYIGDKSSTEYLKDSGWITVSLTKAFKPYNGTVGNAPRYRKIGKLVEINGVISPTETIKRKCS